MAPQPTGGHIFAATDDRLVGGQPHEPPIEGERPLERAGESPPAARRGQERLGIDMSAGRRETGTRWQ